MVKFNPTLALKQPINQDTLKGEYIDPKDDFQAVLQQMLQGESNLQVVEVPCTQTEILLTQEDDGSFSHMQMELEENRVVFINNSHIILPIYASTVTEYENHANQGLEYDEAFWTHTIEKFYSTIKIKNLIKDKTHLILPFMCMGHIKTFYARIDGDSINVVSIDSLGNSTKIDPEHEAVAQYLSKLTSKTSITKTAIGLSAQNGASNNCGLFGANFCREFFVNNDLRADAKEICNQWLDDSGAKEGADMLAKDCYLMKQRTAYLTAINNNSKIEREKRITLSNTQPLPIPQQYNGVSTESKPHTANYEAWLKERKYGCAEGEVKLDSEQLVTLGTIITNAANALHIYLSRDTNRDTLLKNKFFKKILDDCELSIDVLDGIVDSVQKREKSITQCVLLQLESMIPLQAQLISSARSTSSTTSSTTPPVATEIALTDFRNIIIPVKNNGWYEGYGADKEAVKEIITNDLERIYTALKDYLQRRYHETYTFGANNNLVEVLKNSFCLQVNIRNVLPQDDENSEQYNKRIFNILSDQLDLIAANINEGNNPSNNYIRQKISDINFHEAVIAAINNNFTPKTKEDANAIITALNSYKSNDPVRLQIDKKVNLLNRQTDEKGLLITHPPAYGGIGLSVKKDELGKFVITGVAEGSPASHANLYEGLVVTSVEGLDLSTCTLDELTSAIRGQVNTRVPMMCFRNNTDNDQTPYPNLEGSDKFEFSRELIINRNNTFATFGAYYSKDKEHYTKLLSEKPKATGVGDKDSFQSNNPTVTTNTKS